jgi:Dna[CI] antecedent DciA-like protein
MPLMSRSNPVALTTAADGDDYYVRMHRARDYFLPFRIRGNAWRLGMRLIDLCIESRQKGLWISNEQNLATAAYLKLPALRRAVRKLEECGIIRRHDWVEIWWYEIRPHHEWRSPKAGGRWWRWARATVRLRKWNPAALTAYQHEWREIVGEEPAKHSAPVRKDGRTLEVACETEVWRDRLDEPGRRKTLVRRLRVRFGEISRVRFVIGPLPASTN